MKTTTDPIAELIKSHLEQTQMTVTELASRCGVGAGVMADVISGRIALPFDLGVKVAVVVGLPDPEALAPHCG